MEQLDRMHDRLDKVEAKVKQSTYNSLGRRRVEKPQDNCNENQKEQISFQTAAVSIQMRMKLKATIMKLFVL